MLTFTVEATGHDVAGIAGLIVATAPRQVVDAFALPHVPDLEAVLDSVGSCQDVVATDVYGVAADVGACDVSHRALSSQIIQTDMVVPAS